MLSERPEPTRIELVGNDCEQSWLAELEDLIATYPLLSSAR